MQKKDLDLEKKLNAYLEEEVPPKRLLQPAAELLREKNARASQEQAFSKSSDKKRTKKFRLGFYLTTAAAGIIVLAVLLINLLPPFRSNDSSSQNNGYYTMAQLSGHSIDRQTVERDYAHLFPAFKDATDIVYMAYYLDGADMPAIIKLKTRIFSDGGYDEIIVYAELSEDIFSDFKHYYSYESNPYADTARAHTFYKNGEWITRAFIESGGVKYYMDAMSSVQRFASFYFNLLTN